MCSVPVVEIASLALFMLLVLASALYGLSLSGHFPGARRDPALMLGVGPTVLRASIAATAVAAAAGLIAAAHTISAPAAVIAGGAMLLAAPLVLRLFSDRFVDGRGALIAFAAAAALSALVLIWTACG